MKRLLRLTTALMLAFTLSIASAPAFAESGSSGTEGADDTSTSTNSGNEHRKTATLASETEHEKQTAAKERVCETHKRVVTNIETRIASRGQKRMDVITKIAERVEKFYTDKGLTVSNYDTLVANVNAKKDAVQTTLDTIKTDATNISSFTCGDGQGKVAVTQFKTDLKAEQTALKAYQTAVKDLIVGVKTAAGSTSNTEGNQ
jgi:hypothetical protein